MGKTKRVIEFTRQSFTLHNVKVLYAGLKEPRKPLNAKNDNKVYSLRVALDKANQKKFIKHALAVFGKENKDVVKKVLFDGGFAKFKKVSEDDIHYCPSVAEGGYVASGFKSGESYPVTVFDWSENVKNNIPVPQNKIDVLCGDVCHIAVSLIGGTTGYGYYLSSYVSTLIVIEKVERTTNKHTNQFLADCGFEASDDEGEDEDLFEEEKPKAKAKPKTRPKAKAKPKEVEVEELEFEDEEEPKTDEDSFDDLEL